jgi:two-component system, LuxR family, response regulator FixJ
VTSRGSTAPSPRVQVPTSRGKTDAWVAIVDDDLSVRSSLARALRLEGIRTVLFASAEEFLDGAEAERASCLVLDMHLPGLSGHDLAHFIDRERPPRPPTIFITGHDDLFRSLGACCVAHGRLRKPFEIDVFLSLVTPLLGNAGGPEA